MKLLSLLFHSSFSLRFKKNRLALIGLGIITILALLAIFAPFITPYDPSEFVGIIGTPQPPSLKHPFGTDVYGRDYFSRAIYGGRISLTVGLVAVSISVIIGTILGALSGYYGGIIDSLIMRLVDVMLSFPSFFLILTIQAILSPSIYNVMIVIGITSWMGVARLVRGQILSLKEIEFVESARAVGASDFRIIFRHILPNSLAPVIVAATLGVASAILIESALSFLGLGVQPPTPSWGNMLQDAQNYMRESWWLAFFPGILIAITVLSFNFLGDGLRDALDPRLK